MRNNSEDAYFSLPGQTDIVVIEPETECLKGEFDGCRCVDFCQGAGKLHEVMDVISVSFHLGEIVCSDFVADFIGAEVWFGLCNEPEELFECFAIIFAGFFAFVDV